jgi:hypothetical protein
MEQNGYEDVLFHPDGWVAATRAGTRVLVANTRDPEFELEYGRYAITDGHGYESTGYHSEVAAKREAAHLSEATGVDHQVVDVLEQ